MPKTSFARFMFDRNRKVGQLINELAGDFYYCMTFRRKNHNYDFSSSEDQKEVFCYKMAWTAVQRFIMFCILEIEEREEASDRGLDE